MLYVSSLKVAPRGLLAEHVFDVHVLEQPATRARER